MSRPRYPIYIPSKNRADVCYTAKFFLEDGVDFKIVVEPSQQAAYEAKFGRNQLLILPEDDMRLLGSRLWIREHSIAAGFDRHWQFDDNIRGMHRLHKGRIVRINACLGIVFVEDFTDRYKNIGLSGFNYEMFIKKCTPNPFVANCHVYSSTLVNNRMPYKWRLFYNDDTDLCLQVLTNGLCTVAFNAFTVAKCATMVVKGGNTEDLYQKDGRLIMARTLEEVWPDWVTTKWRFGRPQHVVKNSWRDFKTPLIRRTDIDWGEIQKKEHSINLVAKSDIRSDSLRAWYENQQATNTGPK